MESGNIVSKDYQETLMLNQSYWTQSLTKKDSFRDEYCFIPKTRFMYSPYNEPIENKAEFYISKHTVTKKRFKQFLSDSGHDYSSDYLKIMDVYSPFDDCPATPVSWEDAKMYARWMRDKTNEYYSLPSEIEWELASRGPDGRTFPWGEDYPTYFNATVSIDFPQIQTTPVGAKETGNSPYNCCDMAGNVWEWCLDEFDEYDNGNDIHVLRGGSCVNDPSSCCCTSRKFSYLATVRASYAGFRLIYLPEQLFVAYRLAAVQVNSNIADTVHKTIIL